jgi:hypothetical protein
MLRAANAAPRAIDLTQARPDGALAKRPEAAPAPEAHQKEERRER